MSLGQVKWRRAGGILRSRIADFAEEVIFIKEAALAQDLYFKHLDGVLDFLDEELMVERCFEWFIFDYPLSSGQTVIELFRDLYAHRLPFGQALLLILWENERNRFYEVQTVFPGRGLMVQDVLSGKLYGVREPAVSNDVVSPGHILYARLLRVGRDYEFSTSAIGVPEEAYPELIEWLQSDYRYNVKRRPYLDESGWNEYLRFRSPAINRKVIRLGLGYHSIPVTRTDAEALPRILLDLLREPPDAPTGKRGKADSEAEVLLSLFRGRETAKGADGEKHCTCRPDTRYASVAREVACGLAEIGSTPEEVNLALRLWQDFCAQEQPAVRKPGVWAASVIYTVSRLHGRTGVSQEGLARRFGVASSSISSTHVRLSRALASPKPPRI